MIPGLMSESRVVTYDARIKKTLLCKIRILKKFKFSLGFENSIRRGCGGVNFKNY